MKNTLRIGIAMAAIVGFMASCSTSNNVASKRSIQKRKYNKGFYIDFNKKIGKNAQTDEVVETKVDPVKGELVLDQELVETKPVVEKVTPNNDAAAQVTDVAVNKPAETVKPNRNQVTTTSRNGNVSPEELTVETVDFDKKTIKEVKSKVKADKKQLKRKKEEVKKSSLLSDEVVLYYVLAVLIPFLAVGLVTNWDIGQVLLNVLLCILCGIPGIIHALIVVSRNV